MTSLRVVLVADEAAGARARKLVDRSVHQLVAVARQPGQACEPPAATDEPAPATFDARRVKTPELAVELSALAPDVLLNVHSLYKVHPHVLEVFAVGAWNLHPGPLPEAAGINVPSWAIANGHHEHGVTLHEMTANYDEGAIAYEDRFPIHDDATGLTLSAECASRGLRLVRQLIDQLADDPAAVPRIEQDLDRRHFYGVGQPNDGVIDWTRTAAEIEAYVRAADFRPFASPWSPPVASAQEGKIAVNEVLIDEPLEPGDAPADVRRDDGGGIVAIAAADRWVRIVDSTSVTP